MRHDLFQLGKLVAVERQVRGQILNFTPTLDSVDETVRPSCSKSMRFAEHRDRLTSLIAPMNFHPAPPEDRTNLYDLIDKLLPPVPPVSMHCASSSTSHSGNEGFATLNSQGGSQSNFARRMTSGLYYC